MTLRLVALLSVLVLSCGGVTRGEDDDGSTRSSSGGDPGGTGAAGSGAAGSGAAGGVTTGTGAAGGTTTSTGPGGGVGGSSVECAGLGHVECIGAFPSCAPVYDDACCSSCDEGGGCADCIDMYFVFCSDWESACGATPSLPCGAPTQAGCAGVPATCGAATGSPSPCGAWAGCTAAYCALDVACETEPVCSPVTGGSCTAFCNALPPPCPPGLTAEAVDGCWTGMCIEAVLCGILEG